MCNVLMKESVELNSQLNCAGVCGCWFAVLRWLGGILSQLVERRFPFVG